jgi:hypothetical protein
MAASASGRPPSPPVPCCGPCCVSRLWPWPPLYGCGQSGVNWMCIARRLVKLGGSASTGTRSSCSCIGDNVSEWGCGGAGWRQGQGSVLHGG